MTANQEKYRLERLDPRWQKKRLEIMQRDGFMCVHCFDDTATLNVHHKYYVSGRKPWNYPDWALETACRECHKDIHDLEKSGEFSYSEWERTVEILLQNSRAEK